MGKVIFELEAALKSMVQEAAFPGSETFKDPDKKPIPERCIRLLIESLEFWNTLSAIAALSELTEGADL